MQRRCVGPRRLSSSERWRIATCCLINTPVLSRSPCGCVASLNSAIQLRQSFDVQVEDLELRAAIAGDLTRLPHAQQWAGAFGAAAGQPEQLFYIDAEVSPGSINVLSPRRDLHCSPSTSSAGRHLDSPRKAAQRRSVSLQGCARSNRWLPLASAGMGQAQQL